MEQILLSQLSCLKQTAFHLTLRAHHTKISPFRKELASFLTNNSITVDIVKKQDNFLTGEKVTLISETSYSNNSKTIESIYTGSFNPIIFQYVLNHCKQKLLIGNSEPLPEGTFKFKIQPLIRIQPLFPKGNNNNRTSKLFRPDRQEEMHGEFHSITQRNSTKSNRHIKSSRKNEEDYSPQHVNHEYHGRRCYCCSNKSPEDSQLQDEFGIFTRIPKKSTLQNKQNSTKKPLRSSDYQSIIKRTSPQSLTHQLSMRGTSSQSDRNRKSPNLYLRKQLHTLYKKQAQVSNRCTTLAGNAQIGKTETLEPSVTNNCIKTKRNGDPLANTCDLQYDKTTYIKKQGCFSKTVSGNSQSNVFKKAYKPILIENKGQMSEIQTIIGPQSNMKQRQKFLSPHQKRIKPIQNAAQRYSQMVVPHDNKVQIMGGYSIDQKSNKNIPTPGVQRKPYPIHHRNESLQSFFKSKKDLDPIQKIKMTNQAKLRNNQDAPIIIGKTREKTSPSAKKFIPQCQKFINVERSLNKNNETTCSSNRLASNRIKKIPIAQKMSMMKQGNGHKKNEKREEKIENEHVGKEGQLSMKDNMKVQYIKSNVNQSRKVNYNQIQQKSPTQSKIQNNNKKKSPNMPQKVQKSMEKNINLPKKQQKLQVQKRQKGQQRQGIVNYEKNSINIDKQNDTKPNQNEVPQHDDDDFSVTQQRINNFPEAQAETAHSHDKSSSNRQVITRQKTQNDLASTIKQINYEQQDPHKPSQSPPNNITNGIQDQNELIPTCRTIPLRNDSSEHKYELQSPKEPSNERNSEQRYFDDLIGRCTQSGQNQNPPKISIKEQSLVDTRARCFHTCESRQILDNQSNNILNPCSNSDILREIKPTPHQQSFDQELCDESQPSEFSSTAQVCIKPNPPPQNTIKGKKNRLSIDGKLLSPYPARKQYARTFTNQNSPRSSRQNIHIKSQKKGDEENLSQFERQLFGQAPKSNMSQAKQPIQSIKEAKKETQQASTKCSKEGMMKDFLRLQTIDEVNESIYRQNDKKEVEEKLNSASIASNASIYRLEENLSGSSSKMRSDSNIENINNSKRDVDVEENRFQMQRKKLNTYKDCKSKREMQSNEQRGDFSQQNVRNNELPQTVKQKINYISPNQPETHQQSYKIQKENEQLGTISGKQPSVDGQEENQTNKTYINTNQKGLQSSQRQQYPNEFCNSAHKTVESINKIGKISNSDEYHQSSKNEEEFNLEMSVKIIQPQEKVASSQKIQQSIYNSCQQLENKQPNTQKVHTAPKESTEKSQEGLITKQESIKKPIIQPQCIQITQIQKEKMSQNLKQPKKSVNSATIIKNHNVDAQSAQRVNDQNIKKQGLSHLRPSQKIPSDHINRPTQSHSDMPQQLNCTPVLENIPFQDEDHQKMEKLEVEQEISPKMQAHYSDMNVGKEQNLYQKGTRNKKQGQINQRVKKNQAEAEKEQPISKQKENYVNNNNNSMIREPSTQILHPQYPNNISKSSQMMDQPKFNEVCISKSDPVVERPDQYFLSSAKNHERHLKIHEEHAKNPITQENSNKPYQQRKISLQQEQKPESNIFPHPVQSEYPSKAPTPVLLLAPQHKNIEVQTDYLLPNNEQSLPHQSSPINKSRSDHLAKKKCKMNLCQPQIINTCSHIITPPEDTLRDMTEKTSTEFIPQMNHKEQRETEDRRPLKKQAEQRQSKKQAHRDNAVLTTEPSNYFNDLRPNKEHRETGKNSAFSNILDISNHGDIRSSSKENPHQQTSQQSHLHPVTINKEQFRLQFKNQQLYSQTTHPEIINRLVYKNIHAVKAPLSTNRPCSMKKVQAINNALSFLQKQLPNILSSTINKEKTEACLFMNNQWILFRRPTPFTLHDLLRSQFRQESVYKCIQAVTGMPIRSLRDKEQDGTNRRLIKSLKSLLQRKQQEKGYESVLYGVTKMSPQVVSLQKVRYFLQNNNSKQSKTILECHRPHPKKGQQLCNIQADAINQFTQLFLLKNPKYLTLSVDPLNVNTYEIDLSRLIFYISGNYKFILYQQTAKNEYRLIKESVLWLKHKNQKELTRFLLIIEPIKEREGQHVLTVRMALPEGEGGKQGGMTNRVVKYENGGIAKGYQGGYENQKNLYLPISRQITK